MPGFHQRDKLKHFSIIDRTHSITKRSWIDIVLVKVGISKIIIIALTSPQKFFYDCLLAAYHAVEMVYGIKTINVRKSKYEV